jgi:hypothetical protein
VRFDKLRGWAPWFAFASPLLIILAFILAFALLVVTIANHGPGSPLPAPPDPPWFLPAEVVTVVSFGLSLLSPVLVAIALEWIEHPLTHTPLTYRTIAAAFPFLAYVVLLAEGLFQADVATTTATWFVLIAAAGTYLVVINVVGLRAGSFGRAMAWTGLTAGVLLLLVAMSNLVNWPGVTVALVLAALLFITWSVWLGFRLRARAFTSGAVTEA